MAALKVGRALLRIYTTESNFDRYVAELRSAIVLASTILWIVWTVPHNSWSFHVSLRSLALFYTTC